MPLAGDILPALPNGDQRWREQQRSVGRLERNRREKRVGVRAPTSGEQQRSTPPRRDRVRAEPKRAVARALVRADAKPERRRPRASTHVGPARRRAAPRKALAKAHAKAEEAAAPARLALNLPPARMARSKHSAVELNGPALDLHSAPVRSFQRTRRPSCLQEGRFLFGSMLMRPRLLGPCSTAGTYLVRQLVAKSRHVSSFAWPVRFISCHSRPQSRIRARDAAGKAGNTTSLPRGGGILVAPDGVVCFGEGVSICGDARLLEPVGFVAPGARAVSRTSVPRGSGE
jgi:hypothetical protein